MLIEIALSVSLSLSEESQLMWFNFISVLLLFSKPGGLVEFLLMFVLD